MNYYPFHLGDYAAHTAHLEPMEDLAYRRMLDLYYLREEALPQDPAEVARLIRMRANVAEVEAVLREFFTNNDGDGWIHLRCEAEITKMQDKQAKARASAQASVAARSTNAQRTLNERSTKVELPTPTPVENPPTPRKRGKPAEPAGFDEFWKAYPRRVAKGAAIRAWAKLNPDPALCDAVMKALNRASKDPDWGRDGGRYIPHPATWLNAARWLDEPVRIVSSTPAVEIWKPPPPPTAAERAASEEARRRVMAAVRSLS